MYSVSLWEELSIFQNQQSLSLTVDLEVELLVSVNGEFELLVLRNQ